MILPICIYGHDVLRKVALPVEGASEAVATLIRDMVETMYHAEGIGLAAPQVGKPLQIFVVDVTHLADEISEDHDGDPPPVLDGPQVFINPIIEEVPDSDSVGFEEGCLSIPLLREFVDRPETVSVQYLDGEFQRHHIVARGMLARVIQHEYDHLQGVLFVDHLSVLKRRLLRRRLRQIALGDIEADYPVVAPSV
ncbi:peptide deformylase [soil metagenome]